MEILPWGYLTHRSLSELEALCVVKGGYGWRGGCSINKGPVESQIDVLRDQCTTVGRRTLNPEMTGQPLDQNDIF